MGMTVLKLALANLGMWVRDQYFPASYAHATWNRLLPFFQLPGRVTEGKETVSVELCPFNDRQLNRDLRVVCERVTAAHLRVPDGRPLCFTLAGTPCLFARLTICKEARCPCDSMYGSASVLPLGMMMRGRRVGWWRVMRRFRPGSAARRVVVVMRRWRVRTAGSLAVLVLWGVLVMVHRTGQLVNPLVCPRWDLPPPGRVSRLVRGIVIGPAFAVSFGFVFDTVYHPLWGINHTIDNKAKKAQKDDESE